MLNMNLWELLNEHFLDKWVLITKVIWLWHMRLTPSPKFICIIFFIIIIILGLIPSVNYISVYRINIGWVIAKWAHLFHFVSVWDDPECFNSVMSFWNKQYFSFFLNHYAPVIQANWRNMTFTAANRFPLIHALGDPSQVPTRIWTQLPSMRGGWLTNWAIPENAPSRMLYIVVLSRRQYITNKM